MCPKCLMAVKDEMVRLGMDTILVARMMSKVCNAAPTAPVESDPCQCRDAWMLDLSQAGGERYDCSIERSLDPVQGNDPGHLPAGIR
jgi:hypothetical protein